ncbi:MAG: DNA repair protein RecN [Acholeplasmataceae bacterium]|jgi:DNA repair protein RecN (Recombination protein N)|nr:DNA repair protein RecN [Acholeplasmataceae bacterium]
MILKLKVSNFALIDDLEMTFEKGLTAMTGETGAGKSIILESLQLLFGKRSDAQMIRHGESKATVFGAFKLTEEQQDVLDLPEMIEIEREIDLQGRHVMKLNHQMITLAKLKDVMNAIGHIHSQNDTMTLFDKAYYLTFVDQVDQKKTDALLSDYLIKRSHYLDKKRHFESLKHKKAQSIEKQSFLEFQVQELKNYHLIPNEKEDLEDQIEKLKNFDKIMNQLRTAYELIEHEHFSIDQIYEASKALDKISTLDKSYLSMKERLASAYYELDDVKSEIYQTIESLDFDEDAFAKMQDRLYDIIKIEQKYQKTYTELIDYLFEIEEELLLITDYDHYLQEASDVVKKAFDVAFESGQKLSNQRKANAKKLEKDVILELKDLDLDKASFEIVFDDMVKDEAYLLENGIDQIEFYISLNEGEPVKPLAKVASGGERARFMFALRSIYAKANHLSILILDEIDIGISGKTAAKVANKMQKLSDTMQLIVITHLPQVAAKALHHYGIIKQKEKERMVTRILKLNQDERIEMIAMMLSDEKLSHFAIEQAKMLLKK